MLSRVFSCLTMPLSEEGDYSFAWLSQREVKLSGNHMVFEEENPSLEGCGEKRSNTKSMKIGCQLCDLIKKVSHSRNI